MSTELDNDTRVELISRVCLLRESGELTSDGAFELIHLLVLCDDDFANSTIEYRPPSNVRMFLCDNGYITRQGLPRGKRDPSWFKYTINVDKLVVS